MNNEPVAWTKKDTLTYLGNYNYGSITIQVQKSNSVGFDIPLYAHPVNPYQSITDTKIEPTVVSYTHPAELTAQEVMEQTHRKISEAHWKVKELTDEEILCEGRGCALEDDWERLEFARAILRKAQEK
jgi:hypothetical protein